MGRRSLLVWALWVALAGAPLAAQEMPPVFRDSVPEPTERWVGEPVTMSLKEADLVETLRTFARLGNFNLLIQPGLSGKVTVELKDVPWDQAMSTILRMNGLGMDLSQGTLRIAPVGELARMAREEASSPSLADAVRPNLKVEGQLKHLDAALAARLLTDLFLTERGRAWANPSTNTLTVTDRAARLKRVARLVARLDAEEIRGEDRQALRRRARIHWPKTAAAPSR